MATFVGEIRNELRSEQGVNISVLELDDEKVILAPSGPILSGFNKTVDGDSIKFILRPSSGGTESGGGGSLNIKADVKDGDAMVNKKENYWEVEIKSSSESSKCVYSLSIEMEWK